MAHDHRMNPVGEPYLNRKIMNTLNRKIMNTPQGYIDKYPRLLHALDMPDDRAINLLRRHQANISTLYEKKELSNASSEWGRFYARTRKPKLSYYTQPHRPFNGMGGPTEDF